MGIYHEKFWNALNAALHYELLDADGNALGQYTYFPRREAGQEKADSGEIEPGEVLHIRDRKYSARVVHRYIGHGRWATGEPT